MKNYTLLLFCLLFSLSCKVKKTVVKPNATVEPLAAEEVLSEVDSLTAATPTDYSDNKESLEPKVDSHSEPTPRTYLGNAVEPEVFTLEGYVRDRSTRDPISNATVVITGDDQELTTQTANNGHFNIVLPNGCYKVRIFKSEFRLNRPQEICNDLATRNESNKKYVLKESFYPEAVLNSAIGSGENGSNNTTPDPGVGSGTATKVIPGNKNRPKSNANTKPNPTSAIQEDLTRNLDKLASADYNAISSGTFNYEKIPPLPLDTFYIFQLEIIPGKDTSKFKLTGESSGGTVHKEIKVSSDMQVTIVSPTGAFDIKRLSDGIQLLDPELSTLWSWEVRPKRIGIHPVILTIDMLTRSSLTGELRKNSLEVFKQDVKVLVVEKNPDDKGDEAGFNWGFIAIPILLLAVVLSFFLLKKKKEKEKSWIAAPETAGFLLKVEKEIASGETEIAIQQMLQFFEGKSEKIHSDLLSLSAEYNQFKRSFNLGLNPPAETLNRINLAVIELVNSIQASLAKN